MVGMTNLYHVHEKQASELLDEDIAQKRMTSSSESFKGFLAFITVYFGYCFSFAYFFTA